MSIKSLTKASVLAAAMTVALSAAAVNQAQAAEMEKCYAAAWWAVEASGRRFSLDLSAFP